jgi:hypothetical protein
LTLLTQIAGLNSILSSFVFCISYLGFQLFLVFFELLHLLFQWNHVGSLSGIDATSWRGVFCLEVLELSDPLVDFFNLSLVLPDLIAVILNLFFAGLFGSAGNTGGLVSTFLRGRISVAELISSLVQTFFGFFFSGEVPPCGSASFADFAGVLVASGGWALPGIAARKRSDPKHMAKNFTRILLSA